MIRDLIKEGLWNVLLDQDPVGPLWPWKEVQNKHPPISQKQDLIISFDFYFI